MALLHFHYLVTAFGLTVWTHAPALILALIWAIQGVMYVANITVTDLDDYIFWQFLTSFAGVAIGVALLVVTRVPRFLRFEGSYVGVWGQFILWTVFFLAAQLFYGFLPPPGQPWGIIGTSIAHVIIQVVLWVVMYYNMIIFRIYNGRKYFFLLWTLTLVVMELLFFIAYAVAERWTAYIATGGGALILLIAALIFPLKMPYNTASPVSGEPLIRAREDNGAVTSTPLGMDTSIMAHLKTMF